MKQQMYRLALRTWPSAYRRDHGDELVSTALELRNGQFSSYEFASLALNGLGARQTQATGDDPRLIWDGSVRLGLLLMFAQVLSEVLTLWIERIPDYMTEAWSQTVLSAVVLSAIGLAFFMVLRARAMSLVLCSLVGVSWFWGPASMPRLELAAYSLAIIVPALWLTRANRRTGSRVVASFLAWVALVVSTALTVGSYWATHDALIIALSIAALAIAAWDPRLLIGIGIFWVLRLFVTMPALVAGQTWGSFGPVAPVQLTVLATLALGCLSLGSVAVKRRRRYA